jgi:hypothetical protein
MTVPGVIIPPSEWMHSVYRYDMFHRLNLKLHLCCMHVTVHVLFEILYFYGLFLEGIFGNLEGWLLPMKHNQVSEDLERHVR